MVADELAEAKRSVARASSEVHQAAGGDARLAQGVTDIAVRIEAIAERLERS